ncbi:MAG TPA: AraC family transcriptional regulator [Rhizomicrobium sp.]|nr:AraC family transcriptional regulator [Rhizomicrobium sp.]
MTLAPKNMILDANRRPSSRRPPSVAAGFARGLMQLAAQKGADPARLAERVGLDPATLDDQDARVPLPAYVALMHAAKEMTGDPALALHFGEAFEIDELTIVGLIGGACRTMAEAFAQLARYSQLIIDVPVDDAQGRRLVIVREAGQVWIVDTRSDPNAFPELTESSFARMAAAVHRRRSGADTVAALHVTHKAPAHAAEYERVFELPVVFESARNALLMKGDGFLDIALPKPSRYAFAVLSARAEALLGELDASITMRGEVESALLPILHAGDASMDAVARKLALSRQTLARRLKAEGTTFEKVLDALRHRLALAYLGNDKVSVHQCAYLTGFSDPAAFSRAFKRWTGATPGRWRRHRPESS